MNRFVLQIMWSTMFIFLFKYAWITSYDSQYLALCLCFVLSSKKEKGERQITVIKHVNLFRQINSSYIYRLNFQWVFIFCQFIATGKIHLSINSLKIKFCIGSLWRQMSFVYNSQNVASIIVPINKMNRMLCWFNKL